MARRCLSLLTAGCFLTEMIMDTILLLEICEKIGGVTSANGNFQHWMAFDLDRAGVTDFESFKAVSVGALVNCIHRASDRYKRIHSAEGLTDSDVEWLDEYDKWMETHA